MLHAVPPQRAPKLIRESALANEAGWLDLEDDTLRHKTYANIFGAWRRERNRQRKNRCRGAQAGTRGG